MTKSQIFKTAHNLTKATVKAGDSYSATFAICLSIVISASKTQRFDYTKKSFIVDSVQVKLGTSSYYYNVEHSNDGVYLVHPLLNKKFRFSHTVDCGKTFVKIEGQDKLEVTCNAEMLRAFANCYNKKGRKLMVAADANNIPANSGLLFSLHDEISNISTYAAYIYS